MTAELPASPQPSRPLWQTALRWSPIAILVFGGIAAFAFGLGDYLSLSELIRARANLVAWVEGRPVLTVLIYGVVYILAVILSVPGGSLLTVVGGVLFGGVVGGILTTLVATLASVLVFLAARSALGDSLMTRVRKMGPRINRFADRFHHNAFAVIVFLRLVPVMPYWASNVVPALFSVRLVTYTLATLVGLLPWTVSFAFVGAALDDAVLAQEAASPGCAAAGTCEVSWSALVSGQVVTGVLIAIAAIMPAVWLTWRQRRKPAIPDDEPPPPEAIPAPAEPADRKPS